MHDRREFLAGLTGLALWWALPAAGASTATSRTRVILLGTKGGPAVGRARSGPSTLLMINGVPYVVDCGYGTSRSLVTAGVALSSVRYVFVTHHHSDHNLECGPLAYNAWVTGKTIRIDEYGPRGLKKLIGTFFDGLKYDIDTRIADEGRPDVRKLVHAHEFTHGGVIFENADVKVTAARVRHPPIEQSYALRFDTADRSVVVSGDTTYSPELIELAKGADVLVHEAMYMPGVESLMKHVANAARLREHLVASHTTTEDVGRVAAAAGVKTVVLTHFVPGDDPTITDEQWAEGVRKNFKGTVIVGRDQLEI